MHGGGGTASVGRAHWPLSASLRVARCISHCLLVVCLFIVQLLLHYLFVWFCLWLLCYAFCNTALSLRLLTLFVLFCTLFNIMRWLLLLVSRVLPFVLLHCIFLKYLSAQFVGADCWHCFRFCLSNGWATF